jgi:hypothetical protein
MRTLFCYKLRRLEKPFAVVLTHIIHRKEIILVFLGKEFYHGCILLSAFNGEP